jgi:DNA-binding winged helix-turn-helix (wHTH) protein
MEIPRVFLKLVLSFVLFANQFPAFSNAIPEDQHRSVVIRKVGHEVLLMAGDSSSIVLPVTHADRRYLLRFAGEFGFQPELLASTIDSVLQDANVNIPYLVEVISCVDNDIVYGFDNAVVYGFESGGFSIDDSSGLVPCGLREYESGCYQIAITFGDKNEAVAIEGTPIVTSDDSNSTSFPLSLIMLLVVLLIAVGVGIKRFKSKKVQYQAHIIDIGAYRFDKRNMHLTFRDETIELTSKEADLLFLLHSSANETIERDTILRIVWGDDGDYVGRTLDVFISKLRKKLAGDPAIKIANIRGVGYRLVLDVPGV